MNIKLVVCDIDGTLFHPADELLPDFARAFAKDAGKKGILFTMATGRSLYLARHWLETLNIQAPCVICNGAVIARKNRELYEVTFPARLVKNELRLASELGMSVVLCRPGMDDSVMVRTPWVEGKIALRGIYHDVFFPTDAQWADLKLHKVIVIDKEEQVDRVYSLLHNRKDIHPIYYGKGGFEIMPPNCNKADGVRRLAELLGCKLSEVMAIGNDANDVEMLRECGIGVAVGNAFDDAKSSADYICEKPLAEGVREALAKFCGIYEV